MQHDAAQTLASSMSEQCLGNRIGRLHRIISRRFDQKMRPVGLSLPQLEVLAVLMMRRSVTPSTIAEALAIERSTVSRNVALMRSNGWIETDSTPTGRTKTVSITTSGTEMFASANDAWGEAQSEVMNLLGPGAIDTLDTWLASVLSHSEQ